MERGIIGSHLRFVEKSGVPMALLCLAPALPELSDERVESLVMILQEQTDFAPLMLCDEGTLLTFIKDMQLHRCVQMVKNLQEMLKKELDVGIAYGALTMIDKQDDYDALIARLRRYLSRAEAIGNGKICYGTAKYDFCTEGGEEEIFANFFDEYDAITLYNFYNGMPLSEEVKVLSYQNGVLRIKTSLARAAFLKSEPFTFLKHPLLPDTIKADIVNAVPNRAEVVLTNLRFIDKSPVDRENIRVTPDERIEVSIECANGEELIGTVHSLAVNSVAVKLEDENLAKLCFEEENRHVVLSFDLPEREKRKTHIRISALLRAKKDGQLIFSIYPNHFFKQKIESYIALQQTRLITIMQKMVLNFYQG
ncbi:hypothetical protein [Hydrogenimonas cancrithermarum]|nr:hypothetical protein [Hydrogenimonas cancrithermarum]